MTLDLLNTEAAAHELKLYPKTVLCFNRQAKLEARIRLQTRLGRLSID